MICKNTLSAGLLVLALVLSGCRVPQQAPPSTGAAVWKIPTGATVTNSIHPDAPIISSLFSGVQFSNPPPHHAEVEATGDLTLAPLDPGLQAVSVDVRGFVTLSDSAKADCRITWNGRKIGEARFPRDMSGLVTNNIWYIHMDVPAGRIHKTSPNHMTVELSITPGTTPLSDIFSLDSVDVDAQTNQVPARP